MPKINEVQSSCSLLLNPHIQKKEGLPVLLKITAVVSAILFVFSIIVFTGCFYPKIALPAFHGVPFYYICPPLVITLALFSVSLFLLTKLKTTPQENIQNPPFSAPKSTSFISQPQIEEHKIFYLEDFPMQPAQSISSERSEKNLQAVIGSELSSKTPEGVQHIEKTQANEPSEIFPQEMWMLIFSFLDARSFARVARVCSYFKTLSEEPTFFEKHVLILAKKNLNALEEQHRQVALEKITDIELQLGLFHDINPLPSLYTSEEIDALANAKFSEYSPIVIRLIQTKRISEAKKILDNSRIEDKPLNSSLWYRIVKYEAENDLFEDAKKTILNMTTDKRNIAYCYIALKEAQQGKLQIADETLKLSFPHPFSRELVAYKILTLRLQNKFLSQILLTETNFYKYFNEPWIHYIREYGAMAKAAHEKGNAELVKYIFADAKSFMLSQPGNKVRPLCEIAKIQNRLGIREEAEANFSEAKNITEIFSIQMEWINHFSLKQMEVILGLIEYEDYLNVFENLSQSFEDLADQIAILLEKAEFEFDLGKIEDCEDTLKNVFKQVLELSPSSNKARFSLHLTKLVLNIIKVKLLTSKKNGLATFELINDPALKFLGILSLISSKSLFEELEFGFQEKLLTDI